MRNGKEASVARAEADRGNVVRDEIRKISVPQKW